MKKKKKIKEICKNCRLYNPQEECCSVVILFEGQRHKIPVFPHDKCFFDKTFVAINEKGSLEKFKTEIQEVDFWVENPATGEKTDKDGVVKIRYPDGFFAD